jgi:hypothetical protein
MSRWKIYYSNGSAFSDQDGEPWDAPRRGAQVAVTKWPRSPSARRLLGPLDRDDLVWGRSYYCWYSVDGCWLNHDLPAMVQVYLPAEPRPCVILGEYIDEDTHNAIRKRAGEDPYTRLIVKG